ncbi:MAG: hypothetical protein ABSE90_10690 [Verrucomicrobiota bacterium]
MPKRHQAKLARNLQWVLHWQSWRSIFKFAPGKFSVGRYEGMLFPLAAVFLYPIMLPADFMPLKARVIWELDQYLSGARALFRASKIGCEQLVYGRLAQW